MEGAAATALVRPARKVLILALLLLMAASMARRASSGESSGKDLACIELTLGPSLADNGLILY
jgi:hypothetical protein